jgi:hypothetical protein
MTARARIVIIAGAVAGLVAAFVIASGSGDDENKKTTDDTVPATVRTVAGAKTTATTTTAEPTEPAVPLITVAGGKPTGGLKKIKLTRGDTIRFTVQSDAGGEIHFHGYDVHKDVPQGGGRVTFTVPAKIEGRFVVEVEATGTQIAEVEVDPK